MFASSADANTSTGAPPWIWSTSADDASKLNVTCVPGFVFSKCVPIAVNASVNDAAAETVIVAGRLRLRRHRRRRTRTHEARAPRPAS